MLYVWDLQIQTVDLHVEFSKNLGHFPKVQEEITSESRNQIDD